MGVGFSLQLGLDVLAWFLRVEGHVSCHCLEERKTRSKGHPGLVSIVVVGVLHGGQVWSEHPQPMGDTLEPSLAADAACSYMSLNPKTLKPKAPKP